MKKLFLSAVIMGCMSTVAMAQSHGSSIRQVGPTPIENTCMLRDHVFLINRILTPGIIEKITANPYRILRPGQMHSMDYVEKRLNILIDKKRRVITLRCG